MASLAKSIALEWKQISYVHFCQKEIYRQTLMASLECCFGTCLFFGDQIGIFSANQPLANQDMGNVVSVWTIRAEALGTTFTVLTHPAAMLLLSSKHVFPIMSPHHH